MQSSRFWQELEARIARYDLLSHPFYQAWAAGELTRNDLRNYAATYYHHVAAFPTYLSALHSRLPDGAMRRALLGNLSEEELDSRPHSELWLDFARAMGAGDGELDGRIPPEIFSLIALFRRYARQGSPAEALAVFYAYESQVPRIAKEKSEWLRRRYGAGDAACAYFDLHQEADIYHSRLWRRLLSELLETEPERYEEALDAAEAAARALWHTLDHMETKRRQAAKALTN